MLAITANALYTTLHKRGTTRQLAGAIVICVSCALLLLPAVVWYNMRFSVEQSMLSVAEVQVALAYVALCGWLLPLSVTTSYYLFTSSRLLTTSLEMPRQKGRALANSASAQQSLRTPTPYVFNEETPWGWLEHHGGRFQGQRLALKRTVVTIGRDENNDIPLDDDMASRHHAELAWRNGQVYLTDCDSLNGVLLQRKRIRGSVLLKAGESVEIGSHHFIFLLAEKPELLTDGDDPLANHRWRSSLEVLPADNQNLPSTRSLQDDAALTGIPTTSLGGTMAQEEAATMPEAEMKAWQETALLHSRTPLPAVPEQRGALFIQDGKMEGKTILLNRAVITVGRSIECDIVMNDASISRQHAQFSRQIHGDYVQDLTSRNGTSVNDEPLLGPRLLQFGDRICLGNIHLKYISLQAAQATPLPQILPPQSFARSMSGPVPLKLPSKPKGH